MSAAPTRSAAGLTFRQFFLYVHVLSVTLSAILGIAQVLVGRLEDFRVLLTCMTIAAASVGGLACGALLETGRQRALPSVGLVFTGVAAGLTLYLIWFESLFGSGRGVDEWVVKSAGLSAVFAVAFSHLSLLSLAKMTARYQWSLVVAWVAIMSIAAILATAILEITRLDDFVRPLLVASIVDAAFSVLVPIFHVLSRSELRAAEPFGAGATTAIDTAAIDREIAELETRLTALRQRRAELNSPTGSTGDAPQ